MDSLPSFLPSKTGLVGAAVAGLAAAYSAGRRAGSAIDRDKAFPTWTGERTTMPSLKQSRVVSGRRRGYSSMYRRRLRYGYPRKSYTGLYKRLVRSTGVFANLLIPGGAGAGFLSSTIALSAVRTIDLIGAFRFFRIRKCVVHAVPRVDTSNSGLANNFQAIIGACCDPENTTVPSTVTEVAAYDNSYQKWVQSGQSFRYTFYPKLVNSVGNSGAAAFVGGQTGLNDWIQLNGAGIAIPHNCLKMFANVGSPAPVGGLTYDLYVDVHFDVKGMQ